MWNDDTFLKWRIDKPEFTLSDLEETYADISKYWGSCESGYICLEGSTNPAPSFASDGYECPIGHYCPAGTIIEIPCRPGFINDKLKQGVCQGCPARTYCPKFGMTEGIECETGFFCPGTNGIHPANPAATFI